MTKQVQRRRGTSTQHTSFTGAEGEISVNTTNKSIHVHDGTTAGGVEAARADLANVSDTSLNNALSGNTLASLTITSADINGGTIDGTTIGGTSPAAVTTTSLVATTADINGGTVDGAVIGGASAAAITGTTITATGDVTIADKIIHAGDTNTAIRFPAADTVTVETSGAERLRVDSSGFVGIGASAPLAQLHVATNASGMGLIAGSGVRQLVESSGPAAIQIASGGTTNPAYIFMGLNGDPDATRIASQVGFTQISATGASDYLRFDTGGLNERMRITSAGNVGIGTSSPASVLNVVGDQIVIAASSGLSGLGIQIKGTPLTAIPAGQVQGYIATGQSDIGIAGDLLIAPRTNTTASVRFITGTTPAERMRITSTGNVGIGTSSPDSKMTIQDDSDTTGPLLTLKNQYRSGTTTADFMGGIAFSAWRDVSASASYCAGIYGRNVGYPGTVGILTFHTGNNGGTDPYSAGSERARIDSSGNVGIGTSAPGVRLDVKASALGVATIDNERNISGDQVLTLANGSNANNTSSYYLICQEPEVANRMFIFGNGNVVNLNNSYGALSDAKLKENIVDSGSQWDDIKAIRVRKYSLKADGLDAPNMIGVVAQEVEAAGMGGLVFESPDLGPDNQPTGEVTKQVNYSILYMKSVKALQEAMTRIEALEARITALEA